MHLYPCILIFSVRLPVGYVHVGDVIIADQAHLIIFSPKSCQSAFLLPASFPAAYDAHYSLCCFGPENMSGVLS